MKNNNRKFGRSFTFGLGLLCLSGIAGAQSVQRQPVDARGGQLMTTLVRPDIVRPEIVRPDILRPTGLTNSCPAAVAAVAVAVKAATILAHHVTESFHGSPLTLPGRGELVNVGAYDR